MNLKIKPHIFFTWTLKTKYLRKYCDSLFYYFLFFWFSRSLINYIIFKKNLYKNETSYYLRLNTNNEVSKYFNSLFLFLFFWFSVRSAKLIPLYPSFIFCCYSLWFDTSCVYFTQSSQHIHGLPRGHVPNCCSDYGTHSPLCMSCTGQPFFHSQCPFGIVHRVFYYDVYAIHLCVQRGIGYRLFKGFFFQILLV